MKNRLLLPLRVILVAGLVAMTPAAVWMVEDFVHFHNSSPAWLVVDQVFALIALVAGLVVVISCFARPPERLSVSAVASAALLASVYDICAVSIAFSLSVKDALAYAIGAPVLIDGEPWFWRQSLWLLGVGLWVASAIALNSGVGLSGRARVGRPPVDRQEIDRLESPARVADVPDAQGVSPALRRGHAASPYTATQASAGGGTQGPPVHSFNPVRVEKSMRGVLLDDGRSLPVEGMVLVGSAPTEAAGETGAKLLTLVDIDGSLSPTHIALWPASRGVLVLDRYSLTGTEVAVKGTRSILPAGTWAELDPGDVLLFGGHSVTVI